VKVLLGVGGGIAAYKAAELARALMERGASVETIMTKAATAFIQPLTFASLTGHKVITDLFAPGGSAEETLSSAIEHIRVARDHELLVVAPCTADLLAKFAHGHADDFLSTTYLAFTGKIVLAPAMNTNMWNHPATQRNLAILRDRGTIFVDPDAGYLACGMNGPGRLADPQHIADAVVKSLQIQQDLDGEIVLITAGPTQEPLDPVRFISNRSSGKMGYALAEAARDRGAKVILVSGPVNLSQPHGVELLRVQTALEMRDAVLSRLPETTIIIKSAAVADYHVANVPQQKVKKTSAKVSIDLDPTPDILAECGRRKQDRILIGFAAETQNMVEEARRKMTTKNCDMVVGNLVSQEGIGFESDQNEVTLVMRNGDTERIQKAPKREIAERIFDRISSLRLSAQTHE
jgi:phosphopantothenoylcysteine decarboxylase / phosphopantothenate---cysteine ligase